MGKYGASKVILECNCLGGDAVQCWQLIVNLLAEILSSVYIALLWMGMSDCSKLDARMFAKSVAGASKQSPCQWRGNDGPPRRREVVSVSKVGLIAKV